MMTQDEFPEPRWSVLDGLADLGKLTDAPERGFEHFAVDRSLTSAPFPIGVAQDQVELALRTWRDNDLNT
jgi:hypothetical protein